VLEIGRLQTREPLEERYNSTHALTRARALSLSLFSLPPLPTPLSFSLSRSLSFSLSLPPSLSPLPPPLCHSFSLSPSHTRALARAHGWHMDARTRAHTQMHTNLHRRRQEGGGGATPGRSSVYDKYRAKSPSRMARTPLGVLFHKVGVGEGGECVRAWGREGGVCVCARTHTHNYRRAYIPAELLCSRGHKLYGL